MIAWGASPRKEHKARENRGAMTFHALDGTSWHECMRLNTVRNRHVAVKRMPSLRDSEPNACNMPWGWHPRLSNPLAPRLSSREATTCNRVAVDAGAVGMGTQQLMHLPARLTSSRNVFRSDLCKNRENDPSNSRTAMSSTTSDSVCHCFGVRGEAVPSRMAARYWSRALTADL